MSGVKPAANWNVEVAAAGLDNPTRLMSLLSGR